MTIYETAFHFKIGADDFYNVVHYDITGDTPLDLQDLTDRIVQEWSTTQGTVTAAACNFVDITYRLDIDGSVGVTYSPTGGNEPGTALNNKWAGQQAVLVQKLSNGIVRPTKGRAFCPGIDASGVGSGGEWITEVTAACENFWDGIIIVPFNGNGQAEMQIKASNPLAPNTQAYSPVAECRALSVPSALQSRKKGRGA